MKSYTILFNQSSISRGFSRLITSWDHQFWVLKIFQQTAGLIRSAELRSQVYDWSISMGWPSNFNTLFLFGSQFQSWYQSIEKKFDSNIDSQVSLTTNHKCQLYNPSRNHICKRRKSFCVNQMLFMLCSISMV